MGYSPIRSRRVEHNPGTKQLKKKKFFSLFLTFPLIIKLVR